MKHPFLIAAVLALALSAGLPAPAAEPAQLTADEIRQLFLAQKTRGLVIAPASNTGAASAPGAATTVATPPAYVELDKSDQVNIRIAFDFDSAALRADQKPKLAALCEAMKAVDVARFRIVGHTDAAGTAAYNEKLSLLRAQEVKRHIVGECGIPAERLEAVGVGEQFPFDKADPRADVNRRVEFQALS
jgi:outer membrane protein OmpA-like peptidoglycan-associated protein